MQGLVVATAPTRPGPLPPLGYGPPAVQVPSGATPRVVFWVLCFFMAPSLLGGLSAQGIVGLVPVVVLGPILYLFYRRLYPRA